MPFSVALLTRPTTGSIWLHKEIISSLHYVLAYLRVCEQDIKGDGHFHISGSLQIAQTAPRMRFEGFHEYRLNCTARNFAFSSALFLTLKGIRQMTDKLNFSHWIKLALLSWEAQYWYSPSQFVITCTQNKLNLSCVRLNPHWKAVVLDFLTTQVSSENCKSFNCRVKAR